MTEVTHTTRSLRLAIENGLARITLARPDAGNGIDDQMGAELAAAVEQVTERDDVRCLLLDAEGPNFSLGGDINHFRTIAPSDYGEAFGEMIDVASPGLISLRELDVPLVVAVRGWAVGAALGLVTVADIVLAAEGARFRAGFSGIGLPGDLGVTWLLPEVVGPRRALSMMLENTVVDASTAESWGLVTRTVPDERLDAEALTVARSLAAGPTVAYQHIRHNIHAARTHDLYDHMALERAATVVCGGTHDLAEALEAFAARRTPHFEGR